MQPQRTKYDFIFPIGEACCVAHNLKKYKLRLFSNPFDWTGGRAFEELFDCFLHDFEHFCDQEDIVFYERNPAVNPHYDIYQNKRNKFWFPHDFPIGCDYAEYYPQVRAKYDKRIARLLEKIKSSQRVLLLHIELPETKKKLITEERLIELIAAINEKYPATRIDILYGRHNAQVPDGEVHYRHINENVLIADITNTDTRGEETLDFNSANIANLLSYIEIGKQPAWTAFCYNARNWLRKTAYKVARNIYCKKYKNGKEYTRFFGITFRVRTGK